jgi:hypothetical protein
MSESRPTPRHHFTVEQANAMLPLVRAIVKDLADLSRDVIDRRQRLAHLQAGRNGQPSDVYGEELAQVEVELEKDGRRLREYVEELLKLGVEPKNGPEGLVDFPALIDGQESYLCWKLGEPEVLFWHDLEAGFAGRQSLIAEAGVESAGGSSGEGLSQPGADGH